MGNFDCQLGWLNKYVGFIKTSVLVTVLLMWREAMTKAAYKRKHLIWGLLTASQSQSIIITLGITVGHQGSRWKFIPDLQAEGREIERECEPGVGFWYLKAYLQWHTPSNKAMHPNPSEIVSPTGNPTFKYMSLRVPFSFISAQHPLNKSASVCPNKINRDWAGREPQQNMSSTYSLPEVLF